MKKKVYGVNRANRKNNTDQCSGSGYVSMQFDSKNVSVFNNMQLKQNNPSNSKPDKQASTSEPIQHIRPCCVNGRDGNKLCDVFKRKLQHFYSGLALPKIAWLKEGHELSIAEHFVKLQITKLNKSIEIEDIFKFVNNIKPTRILVDGQPGFGKTTIATKLAYDWAVNKKYMNFKIAFFIPLRELRQRSIQDVIVQIANHIGFKDDASIIQIVNDHEQDTVFILDGLDEVPVTERHEIVKILYKQIYDTATTVVFCRTGLFELRAEEKTQLFGIPNKSSFEDIRISTLGVKSLNAKRQFLLKFIPEAIVDDILEALSSQIGLFDSPLFLMLVPVILEQEKTIRQFETKTEFYKKLLNSVLKHSYVKRGLDIDMEFDMFCYNNALNNIQKSMVEFGMLCLQKILKNQLKFDCDQLTQEIYEFGFLIHHAEITYFKESSKHYEAFHMSILEFVAAFSVWMNFKSNKRAPIRNDLNRIVNHFLDSNGTSLLLPFLANLMEDDLDYLLCQIESHGYLFSFKFELTLKLIAECLTHSIINSKYLKKFIPSHLSAEYTRNESLLRKRPYKELIKYGIEYGKINSIEFKKVASSEFVTNENEMRLRLYLVGETFIVHSNIHCKIQQIFSSPVPFGGTLNECLHFVASSSVIESCSVDYSEENSKQFLRAIRTNKRFNQIKYQYLCVKIKTKSEKQIVMALLERNQVQHLHLIGTLKLNMSGFCRAAACSTELTKLSLMSCTINLNNLTNNGTKKYKYLAMHDCIFVSKHSFFNKFGAYCLLPNEAITRIELSHLDCDIFDLNDLLTNHPTWSGLNSIRSVMIRFNPYQIHLYQMNVFSAFKNLQLLCINLELFVTFDPGNDEVIAKCINSLSIIEFIISKNFSACCSNLFKCMNDLWVKKGNTHLKTIHYNSYDMCLSELLELLNGLRKSFWYKVNFYSYLSFSLGKEFRECLTNFDVTYYQSFDGIVKKMSNFDVDSDMILSTTMNIKAHIFSITKLT